MSIFFSIMFDVVFVFFKRPLTPSQILACVKTLGNKHNSDSDEQVTQTVHPRVAVNHEEISQGRKLKTNTGANVISVFLHKLSI